MTSCRVMWLLLIMMLPVMVSPSEASPPSAANGTRWELLEAAASRIHIEDELIRASTPPEGFRYYLWYLYKGASRSQRLEIVDEMSETLKQIAYRDNRLDMIGLILFGPEKGRSFLRLTYDMLPEPEPEDVLDYVHCVETVEDLFAEHCGPLSYEGLRQSRSVSKLCSLSTKAAIEDAIIHSCGLNIIEPETISNQDADYKGVAHWAIMQILIFLSCVGSPTAIVAAAFCLALKYVIGSIIAPTLPLEKFTDGWTREQVAEWVCCQFRAGMMIAERVSCQILDWMMLNHNPSEDGNDGGLFTS